MSNVRNSYVNMVHSTALKKSQMATSSLARKQVQSLRQPRTVHTVSTSKVRSEKLSAAQVGGRIASNGVRSSLLCYSTLA